MESSYNCYVCNAPIEQNNEKSYSISLEDSTIPTGRPLNNLLTEILDKSVDKSQADARKLCARCFKTCTEYDLIEKRLAKIKADLQSQHRSSALKQDGQDKEVSTSSQNVVFNVPKSKVVVSSSKLKPIPPTFKLNNNLIKLHSNTSGNNLIPKNGIKIAPTFAPAILRKTKKCQVKKSTKLRKLAPKTDVSSKMTLENMAEFLVMPRVDVEDHLGAHVMLKETDHGINIVHDFTTNDIVTEENHSIMETVEQEEETPEEPELLKLSLDNDTKCESSDYVKLEIVENGTDDVLETIIMEDDGSGSLVRVVSGQKVIYVNDEISVIVPENESDKDSTNNDHNEDTQCLEFAEIEYVNGTEDSEEIEGQLELRASGDEETANAIMEAAAREGGAFIKVQSGEMYRVESVATEESHDHDHDTHTAHHDNGENCAQIVQKVGTKFKCLLCENIKMKNANTQTFLGDASNTMRHVRDAHHARVYICRKCGLIMRRRRNLTMHMLKHGDSTIRSSESKMYECDTCSSNFRSRNLLVEHLNTHTKSRPHACDKCPKTFNSKYTLKAHMKTHMPRERLYECNKCMKSFYTQQNLTQHEKTHSNIRAFICKVCAKTFGSQHNLEMHELIHTGVKKYSCDICNKSFARQAEVRDHRRVHTGEKPFTCDICGMHFAQRSNLLSHRRATHLEDRRYCCNLCDKRFKRRRLLDYHIKASHTGERPYQCEFCKSAFVYPEHYKKHLRIHSGDKPYECEMCKKKFTSRDCRNMHRFTHSDVKPYQCFTCGAGFMRKPLLYSHMHTYGHLSENIIINHSNDLTITNFNEESTEDGNTQTPETLSANNIYVNGDGKDGEQAIEITESVTQNYIAKDDLLIQGVEPLYTVSFDTSNVTQQLFATETDAVTSSEKLNIIDASLISTKDIQLLGEEEIIARDEHGATVKLVQMQLENGETSWVALDA